jgi:hypothetical protein
MANRHLNLKTSPNSTKKETLQTRSNSMRATKARTALEKTTESTKRVVLPRNWLALALQESRPKTTSSYSPTALRFWRWKNKRYGHSNQASQLWTRYIGMEKNRRDKEEGQGHYECEVEEPGANADQGVKAQRERARRTHALWEEHEHEDEHQRDHPND